MHCTHCTPGVPIRYPRATTGTSLQIFSFKIAEIKCDLEWPLRVYGVVNARDNVDRNRNLLFCRTRDHCQELTQDDPYLRLTGPSRGILAEDPLEFEVQLKSEGHNRVSRQSLDHSKIPLRRFSTPYSYL